MKRGDYLKTVEGQISLKHRRQRNKLYFILDGYEPRSKNAITEAKKIEFQSAILADMARHGRRHFTAPVALEFEFRPTEDDPPAIHTMPKNYLDLLQKRVKGLKTKRERLVLKDDRDVYYLAVQYNIGPERSQPHIWKKAAPYRDFVAEMALIEKVQHNNLKHVDNGPFSRRASVSWDELAEDDDLISSRNDAYERLKEHESRKQFWVSHFGEASYKAIREMHIRDLQDEILKILTLTTDKLISLLSPLFSRRASIFDKLNAAVRDMLISEPFTINLNHSNLRPGESSRYRAFVKETMAVFKEDHGVLFPLKTQAGITILFQPPECGSIDLDNLARRIVPFVNEELKPPSNLIMTFNAEQLPDPELRKWYQERQMAMKRMPKHSITHYQVIQLPRLSGDSEHGFVRLILESGEGFETLWRKIDTLADRWEKKVTR